MLDDMTLENVSKIAIILNVKIENKKVGFFLLQYIACNEKRIFNHFTGSFHQA